MFKPTTTNEVFTTDILCKVLKHPNAQASGEVMVGVVNRQRSNALKMEVKDTYKVVIEKIEDEIFGINIFKDAKNEL